MTKQTKSMNTILDELLQLLSREKSMIINLDMQNLQEIQTKKTGLLKVIASNSSKLDQEGLLLAAKIKEANRKNGRLLQSGMKLFEQMQAVVHQRRALVYADRGYSFRVDNSPKLVSQRL